MSTGEVPCGLQAGLSREGGAAFVLCALGSQRLCPSEI